MTMYLPARWPHRYRSPQERRRHWAFVTAASAVVIAVAVGGVTEILSAPGPVRPAWGPGRPVVIALPVRPASYIGLYAPMDSFGTADRVRPNIALYYSGWHQPFKLTFARKAAAHHAVPLVQMDPGGVSLTAIAAGRYDRYLRAFAEAVGEFGHQTGRGVIIGFGHEPNGRQYQWGLGHQSPTAWKAAWRHIVRLFRRRGVDDVTWLWTVRVTNKAVGIVSPGRWWPGGRYVTWVGIDGYYYRPSARFGSLFGPTIRAIRGVTRDPILIAETGAQERAGKPVKIADVFSGVRSYGLLGLVWFDARGSRLDSRACAAAFATAASNWQLTG